jgi:hypothetical protein
MPESGTSGSVRDRDGQPPGLLDLRFLGEAYQKSKAWRGGRVEGIYPDWGILLMSGHFC